LSFKPTLRTCPLKKSKQYRVSLSPLSKHRVMTLAFQREGPHTDADLSFSYPIDPPLVHMVSRFHCHMPSAGICTNALLLHQLSVHSKN
jgi:ubiquitin-protein ligase